MKNRNNENHAGGGVTIAVSDQFNASEGLPNKIWTYPQCILLIGDFNSQSPVWGSSNTDNCGKIIEKLLEEPNHVLLNSGAKCTLL